MNDPELKLHVETDNRTGEILAVYFQIRRGKAATVNELQDGVAYANYDRKGRLLGIELLEPCEVQCLTRIAEKEPAKFQNRVKNFFKSSIPRKMMLSV